MNYIDAANYWSKKITNIAPAEVIQKVIDNILSSYRHCTIATSSDKGVDATPVHYIYHDGFVYIFSEGGEKFLHLENNKNVCVSVFNHDGDFGNIHSVQVYGTVSLVEVLSDEYMKVVDNSVYKLNKTYLEKRAASGEPLYLLKIKANRYKVTDSDIKKEGYDINQTWEVE